VLIPILIGFAEDKKEQEGVATNREVTVTEPYTEISNSLRYVQTRVNMVNSNQEKFRNRLHFAIGLSAITFFLILYLLYRVKKFQEILTLNNARIYKKVESVGSSAITERKLQEQLNNLKRDLQGKISSKTPTRANLEPTPRVQQHAPAFINSPTKNPVRGVKQTLSPKRIPVKYDEAKGLFVKDSNSKLYFLIIKSKPNLSELQLEPRMTDNTDISYQNKFNLHFEITRVSQNSMSSGYHMERPALIEWDENTETGIFKGWGKIKMNSI